MLIGARHALWKNKLPYAYKVQYIRNSGSSYIDTGYKLKYNNGMGVIFRPSGQWNTDRWMIFCGTRQGAYHAFNYNTANNSFKCLWDYKSGGYLQCGPISKTDFVKAELIIDEANRTATSYYNDMFVASNAMMTGNTNANAQLFYATGEYRNGIADIQEYWITDGTGARIRDFIAVVDKNGIPCMYEKFTKQLHYNAYSSGSFIAGPKIWF